MTPGRLPRWLWLAALVALGGCAPPVYVQPDLNEPHALVTVRVVHHQVSGPHAQFLARLDAFQIPVGPVSSITPGTPATRTIRVRPTEATWRFASRFTHTEMRMETVWRTEQYACGTQSSGYGTSRTTTTRYCSRQVPRQESRTRTVVDGSCEATIPHAPLPGSRYVFQYDYYGNQQCGARCFVRMSTPDGQFALRPCNEEPLPPGAALDAP